MKGAGALALIGCMAFAFAAAAQTAPPKPPASPKPVASEAPKPDPAKDAFLVLSEADRKAAQDALIWLGHYNGVADGAYGKRTGDAIAAYQKATGLKADGVLGADQLAALKAAGAKPREAFGFEIFTDAATGVQIGAPLRALQKLPGEPGHASFASKDGVTRLDLYLVPLTTGSDPAQMLEALYKAKSADADRRKISYHALKAGAFFVAAGDEGDSKVYMRYAVAPNGALRGFEFRYPRAKADMLDRVSVAMSNAFDANPAAASPTPAASASPAPSAPVGPQLVATALVIAPGQALTALTPADCATPLVAGKAATFGRVDDKAGLARLDGEFGANVAPAAAAEAENSPALVLSRAPAADKSVVEAGAGEWRRLGADAGGVIVSASASARGAPVFDARGELIGVLAPFAAPPRKFGSVFVAEPHRAITGAPLEAFVPRAQTPDGPEIGAAEIARRYAPRVLAVTCGV